MRHLTTGNTFLNQKYVFRIFLFGLIHFVFSSNLSAQMFSKVNSSAINGTTQKCFGAGFIDFNGDGYLDILGLNNDGNCNLFINNQDGTFSLSSDPLIQSLGSYYSGIAYGDYDNDGLDDLFLTTLEGKNALLHRESLATWTRVQNSPLDNVSFVHLHCTWEDYDNDGLLDMFIPTVASFAFASSNGSKNYLFHNEGGGKFSSDVNSEIAALVANNQCASFADYDNDGDRDLFMTEWQKDNFLFENNNDGIFNKVNDNNVTSNSDISMSSTWGDFNNDGFMDLYVGNASSIDLTLRQKNHLYMNNGNKTFTKITTGDAANFEGNSWTVIPGDFDNDGDLDLFAGQLSDPNVIFLNDGQGNFTQTQAFDISSTGSSGCGIADYDKDGFLDIFAGEGMKGGATLYHNNGNNNNWFFVKCIGVISNKNAVGAKVKIKATISGKSVWQYREINYNQGLRSGCDLKAHFGLGNAQTIDSLVITWPSKLVSVFTSVNINQVLEVVENVPEDFIKCGFNADKVSGYSPLLVQFSDKSRSHVSHPITAWSWDFNGDGIEDSNEKNPTHNFETLENDSSFSVTLTVSNGINTKTYTKTEYIHITPASRENLALLKSIKASSSKNPPTSFGPGKIVDGIPTTCWASTKADSQWIKLTLKDTATIGKIILQWQNKYATEYEIKYSNDDKIWNSATVIHNGDGNTDEILLTSFQAKYIRINFNACNNATGYELYEMEVYRPSFTDVDEEKNLPADFSLYQNYPNPFNPTTTISYSIPKTGDVQIKIYDILGREVAKLVDGQKSAGKYTVQWNGSNNASGVYFYSITFNNQSLYKKMLMIK